MLEITRWQQCFETDLRQVNCEQVLPLKKNLIVILYKAIDPSEWKQFLKVIWVRAAIFFLPVCRGLISIRALCVFITGVVIMFMLLANR